MKLESVPLPLSHPVADDATEVSSSAVTWGTVLLAASVFLTTFDFTLLEPVQRFSVDWQTLIRLAVCAACGIYGLICLPYTLERYFRFPGLWAVLFATWALLTVPGAVAPTYCLAACFSLACVILFAPAVLARLSGLRIVVTVLLSALVFIALSWGFYFSGSELGRSMFTMPDGEVTWRVGGDAQQLGFQAAWAIGLMLILGFQKRARWRTLLIPLGVSAITLPFTQSRTAMLVAAALAAAVCARSMRFATLVLCGLGALLVGVLAVLILPESVTRVDLQNLQEKVSRSGNPEELYNLTGRTEIWRHVVAKCQQAPIFGYGYGCSRQVLADYAGGEYGTFDLHHAHNLCLNIVLCTGVVGGLLFVGMALHQVFLAFHRPDPIADLAIVFVLVAGITEPVLFGPMPRSHTVLWLIALFWRPMGGSLNEPAQSLEELKESASG